jgi:hypothetical protein
MWNTIKYTYNEVKENGKSWRWWRGRYRDRIFSKLLILTENKGVYVVDEDWDNLIILDACRYDIFKELNTIEGKLESRISRGSCTMDFLVENFKNYSKYSELNNIVYVTSNPYVNKYLSGRFHKIYPTWKYGWSDKLNTVPPENVVKDALKACRKHPDKRLIVHFMQPHYPFLDVKFFVKTNKAAFNEDKFKDTDVINENEYPQFGLVEIVNPYNSKREQIIGTTPWILLEAGALDRNEVFAAYKNNLKMVLPFVKRLVDILPGKTVVSSDHGNLIAERVHCILYPFREFGHPCGLYNIKQIVEVPWLIIEKEKLEQKEVSDKGIIKERVKRLKGTGKI